MILALLTRVATCVGPKSWHGFCMGQLGMEFAWVDKCVNLCWTLWPYLYITRMRD
jgi:hypothetical protein